MSRVTVPMVTRMEALADVGLSQAAIAAVVSLDWDARVTPGQVRYYLRNYPSGIGPRGLGGFGMSANNSPNFPSLGRQMDSQRKAVA